jgi:hypothetical protein
VPEAGRKIGEPQAPVARVSDALRSLTEETWAEALRRAGVR